MRCQRKCRNDCNCVENRDTQRSSAPNCSCTLPVSWLKERQLHFSLAYKLNKSALCVEQVLCYSCKLSVLKKKRRERVKENTHKKDHVINQESEKRKYIKNSLMELALGYHTPQQDKQKSVILASVGIIVPFLSLIQAARSCCPFLF
ncbi:hypothetical protein ILYODFUR_028509 [Ilyodon furcidens]|uniref:Uncharacterized protein n=1 Tax=Ilyodon furcidens TaxID=33524 RepID=A0ABV0TEA8_9TELE